MRRSSEPIHVAFCSDSGYIPQLAAALVSLFISNWKNQLSVYVVTTGLTARHRASLEKLAVTFGRSLHFHDLDASPLRGLAEYVQPQSTYYRLLLPGLLQDVSRLIYLDCDLVVEIDLLELWQTPQQDKLVLGVAERDELQPGLQAHVGTPADPYINAGVIVMDLEAWRVENVAAKCLQWLKDNPTVATMMDQDAINRVCMGRKAYVPLKWNLNPIHGPARVTLPQFPERILHFAGPLKPWHEWYCHDLAEIFYRYLERSETGLEVTKTEATKLGQHLSAANQHWEREKFTKAGRHYMTIAHLMTHGKTDVDPLVKHCVDVANQAMVRGESEAACTHYRAVVRHWGLPVEHVDIYKIPLIR